MASGTAFVERSVVLVAFVLVVRVKAFLRDDVFGTCPTHDSRSLSRNHRAGCDAQSVADINHIHSEGRCSRDPGNIKPESKGLDGCRTRKEDDGLVKIPGQARRVAPASPRVEWMAAQEQGAKACRGASRKAETTSARMRAPDV